MDKILIVGVGGFIGANVRYWLGAWIDAQFGLRFPLGTFIINLTGSLLLGFIATITLERALIDPRWRRLWPLVSWRVYDLFYFYL